MVPSQLVNNFVIMVNHLVNAIVVLVLDYYVAVNMENRVDYPAIVSVILGILADTNSWILGASDDMLGTASNCKKTNQN